jgi:hypothetical protein
VPRPVIRLLSGGFARWRGGTLQYRGEYYFLLATLWLYSLAWLTAGVGLVVLWDRIGWPARVLVSAGLLIMSPTLEDLSRSYKKYRKLHAQDVRQRPGER